MEKLCGEPRLARAGDLARAAFHGFYNQAAAAALSLDEANRLVAHFLNYVVRVATLWLRLETDRGGPLLRGLLRRYPDWRSEVEHLARVFKFDARRRALHGLPEPHANLTIALLPAASTS